MIHQNDPSKSSQQSSVGSVNSSMNSSVSGSGNIVSLLLRGMSLVLGIQVAGLGVTYLSQVLLARWLGVADYGAYDYAIAWSDLLAFIAGLGLPGAVLRFIPQYIVQEEWSYLRGLIRQSWWITLGGSVAIALISTGILWAVNLNTPVSFSLLLGLWLVPLQSLSKLQLEIARGCQQMTLAYSPSLLGLPIIFIGSLILWRSLGFSLTTPVAIALFAICLFLILVGQFWRFWQQLSENIKNVIPAYQSRQWWAVALPLIVMSGAFVVLRQTDVVMLGLLAGMEDVGIYGAAFKSAKWVNFMLFSVNAIAAPLFSMLYTQGDRQGLQRLVFATAYWMFIPALFVMFGLIFLGDRILNWFGPEFIVAQPAMIALGLGQLVNVGAGSVNYLMVMTGHQTQSAWVFSISAGVNVILNAIAIPQWGSLGAAIATAISMSLWNIWLAVLVVKYLQIHPSIIAAVFHPRYRPD